ncbi:MAG TPA: CHASE3 domain-containing protein [Planctomycetota bacterium]|nr:CHASE3 domain-containing protein [Planctomycetota bacterium]
MTVGKKFGGGYAVAVLLLAIIGGIAYWNTLQLQALRLLVTHTYEVIAGLDEVRLRLVDAETGQRGYLVTGAERYLEPYDAAVKAVDSSIRRIADLTIDNPRQQGRVRDLKPLVAEKLAELAETVRLRKDKDKGFEAALEIVKSDKGKKAMDEIRKVLADMDQEEHDLLKVRDEDAASKAQLTFSSISYGTILSVIVLSLLGFWVTKGITVQIGAAVQHVQNSSSELQSAANQQASGAKEQSTSINEMTTTINELLATSRQISESAQRVAQMAEQTASGARSGDATVLKGQDAIGGIKRQVDLIVNHMLDLGKKAQQIGGILEIINELAEQTNILSINATIEAAGAGESGKRFAVVADEIRKLADRVGNSTKEIRVLIDETRAAVNTTVMATESGSKAVDLGTRQFGDVAASFRQIAELVKTTTEAAREIELSTKQQTSAVEQVNAAIEDIAKASRETEASTTQTFQTATQLTSLSRDLNRIVQPQTSA